ncbi:MAG: hypothetical protein WCE75_16380 [Terracidiphilus sp.]
MTEEASMRRWFAVIFLFALTASLCAQNPAPSQPQPKPKAPAQLAPPQVVPPVIKDLPVRRVVLYKNGVGYFEHSGSVTGNQRVAIDFTSSQLNDVLQSLTVLDEGGGRIGGVNYNSTTPLAEQLKALSLGMTDEPSSTELFQALRGQRVEVAGAPGGAITGRLMSIETRAEKVGGADSTDTVDKYYLTLVAASGAVRVVELTPALSVRPLDASLQGHLDRYLELLSTTHANGLRHLTLNALGTGERQLRVSYISEVPVWKSTYRIVFPRTPNGAATVQGWAVVDNTVGADWDNVQLSLVAGAPQSFIQPLSQPLYTRRPEIPIATDAETTPQTHEAAENVQASAGGGGGQYEYDRTELKAKLLAPRAAVPHKVDRSYGVAGMEGLSGGNAASETVSVAAENRNEADLAAIAPGASGGGVYRASDAIAEGDVATNAFDGFFEYALTAPVTIHKNESAMVPILQQELPAEHVTLWSQQEATPLRAVWLENKSKLTLDKGSFSIFESGEFAGEGLLDPIHPGERRLLSYAADQAMRVKVTAREARHTLHHLSISKGAIVETYRDVASVTYSAVNSGDVQRAVLLEHPRRTNGWELDEGLKPAETAPSLYRFRLPVAAHSTEKLEVREHGPQYVTVDLKSNPRQEAFLIELAKEVPAAETQLKPVIDAQTALAEIDRKIADKKKEAETAAADEARDRENLTALKGNDAARRFVDELNRAEDQLQATRKAIADLEQQKSAAVDKLNGLISALSFEWDAKEEK